MSFAMRGFLPSLPPLLLALFGCAALESCTDSESRGGGGGAGGEASAPEAVTLFSLRDLSPVAREDDAFVEHRPPEVECSDVGGWYREADGIEIDTGSCNYFSMRESATGSAERGDRLSFTLSHYDLTAPEPGAAHVAISIDGDVVLERVVEIPGAGQVVEVDERLVEDVPVGAELVIHLHNHGQNTWQISPLVALPAE